MSFQARSICWLTACFLTNVIVACSHVDDSAGLHFDNGQEWIAYETRPGPFCGDCYTVKATVSYDGIALVEEGYWAGDYTDWQEKKRKAQISSDKIKQFRQRLDVYRPTGELLLIDPEHCETFWTDQSEVIIEWQDGTGSSKLRYNFGCDTETRAELANTLKSALPLLGISNLRYP